MSKARLATFAFAVATTTIMTWWLKSEHSPSEPVRLARAFVEHLEAKQFGEAFELTTKTGMVGSTVEELEAVAERQMCRVDRWVGASPFQSNGNRLRRWASGRDIEPSEVQIEFEGECLLGVTVRHIRGSEWRVSKFQRHAG
jgi:hypothetical protein